MHTHTRTAHAHGLLSQQLVALDRLLGKVLAGLGDLRAQRL